VCSLTPEYLTPVLGELKSLSCDGFFGEKSPFTFIEEELAGAMSANRLVTTQTKALVKRHSRSR
jgi:hypothetical protein